jgi:hypothetical protein
MCVLVGTYCQVRTMSQNPNTSRWRPVPEESSGARTRGSSVHGIRPEQLLCNFVILIRSRPTRTPNSQSFLRRPYFVPQKASRATLHIDFYGGGGISARGVSWSAHTARRLIRSRNDRGDEDDIDAATLLLTWSTFSEIIIE